MTDQKPPVQSNASKPPAPQPAGAAPMQPPRPPAPPQQPNSPKPVAPPLPKPAFTVSAPPTAQAAKPPQTAQPAVPKAPAPVAPPKPPAPPAPQQSKPVAQPAASPKQPAVQPPRPPAPPQQPNSPKPVAPPQPGLPTAPKPVSAVPPKPGIPTKPPGTALPPVPAQPSAGAVRPPASTLQSAPGPRPLSTPKGISPAAAGVAGAAAASTALPKAPVKDANGAPAGQLPPAPKTAEFKKSPLRFLPFVVAVLLFVGLGWFVFTRFFGNKAPTDPNNPGVAVPETEITYWGLWEPTPVLEKTLDEFEAQNPGIVVNYEQQTYRDYRERLQTSIVSGRGPDVFRYHASWVPMLRAELDAMPSSVYSAEEFQRIFFPIAYQQLQYNGKLVGVPLMYEGLALLYNKEVLQTANAEPPKTWAELNALAERLTIRNGNQIQRAGLAVGNASNIDNFSDILGLLMLQNGATPQDPISEKSQEAINFYIDFYRESGVWDSALPNSTVAFARGDVAMIFAPSWRIHEILDQNPNIQVGVAPVPQFSDQKVTWASYWAEGVSAQSSNKEAAWKLLKFLSSQEALQMLHSDATKERSFGEIYPRVDMANLLADNPYAAAYLADAPYAQDWYLNSRTHDNGLNDQIIKYYEDAITALVGGTGDAERTLPTVAQGVTQVLRQYNLIR